ncbi:hypothetical protein AC578_6555 [Pseudocercospora eumusae]|uniref:Zn(2)-C6 fungal-type domain-containing protein n=1 Tax=Pseudocercospora eumusae TaxID=321146 RepID=A0A139HHR9_9PEZI|nr:hypothetical protein AC578_6555 [Pseudocercospora eumusae]
MDYSRPVTTGSKVIILRSGYRIQITVAWDIVNPQAAGVVEVLRYGPSEQDAEDENGKEEDTPATDAEKEDDEAGLLITSPAPTRRTPAPRKGPAAPASTALQRQTRPVPRKSPAESNPAALPQPNQPAPPQPQGQDPFNGLRPLDGTCDVCRAKKKGCNGGEQRPCTRCKDLGFSAAQCVNSRYKKPVKNSRRHQEGVERLKDNKRARKDDDEDGSDGNGGPPAKRIRGRQEREGHHGSSIVRTSGRHSSRRDSTYQPSRSQQALNKASSLTKLIKAPQKMCNNNSNHRSPRPDSPQSDVEELTMDRQRQITPGSVLIVRMSSGNLRTITVEREIYNPMNPMIVAVPFYGPDLPAVPGEEINRGDAGDFDALCSDHDEDDYDEIPDDDDEIPPPAQPTRAPASRSKGKAPLTGPCTRCRKMKKRCDWSQGRPCLRCRNAGLSADECISAGPATLGRPKSTDRKPGGGGGGAGPASERKRGPGAPPGRALMVM